MSEKTPVIELSDLSYEYRTDWSLRSQTALRGISLTVFRGESFGFLGHNGAGKTTTIKCLLGFVTPTRGSIRVLGKSPRNQNTKKSIGYLAEHPYYYDHLTVYELVEMFARLSGLPAHAVASKTRRALERVGLSGRTKAPLRSLSKGLMQRAGMAQAIVADPTLLILDEPFSGLDPIGRREFKDLFFELKQSGVTLFLSTHILEDAEHLCDRASILVQGQLQEVVALKNVEHVLPVSFELVVHGSSQARALAERSQAEVEDHGDSLRLTFASSEAALSALKQALQLELRVVQFREGHETLEQHFVSLVAGRASQER